MASLPMIAASGGTGSELKISVFYTEEFYGETISCSKDSTTLTETATSSGEVEFTVSEEGIWTISCTVDGNLYETEVTVYYDYPATLIAVPEGSTATPTDDIQMWLKCADIRHLNYTSLAQVMADEFTFDTLLRDSNACDYMARSTTWASSITDSQSAMELIGMYDYCSSKLLNNDDWANAIVASDYWEDIFDISVPLMTGSTTGGVTVGQTSYQSSDYGYKAFDRNLSTRWCTASDVSSATLSIDFTNAFKLKYFTFTPVGHYYNSYTLQCYVNNEWITLATGNRVEDGATVNVHLPNNEYTASNYRIVYTANDRFVAMYEVQLYGRHDTQTDIIHSAPQDTIYYKDNEGNEVVLATTNADGIGEVDWSLLETGNYTLYSTVAKNPANLTDDYGKTVKITSTPKGSTTELYVLPRHTLYWYGYKSNNMVNANSANGWTLSYSFGEVVYNTNNMYLKSNGNCQTGVTSDTAINGTKVKTIARASGAIQYTQLMVTRSKAPSDYENLTSISATSDALYECAIVSSNVYPLLISSITNNYLIASALWYNTSSDIGNFISAAYDEVYFYLNGEKVVFAVTDGNGYANLDYSRIPSGFYTLYSSVAKLPNDLSAPYFKRIEITENTTEISLMPDNSSYWYGYNADNIELTSSENGYTVSTGSASFNGTLTKNTNNVYLATSSGGNLYAIADKTARTGKTTAILQAVGSNMGADSYYGRLGNITNKSVNYSSLANVSNIKAITTNTLQKFQLANSVTDYNTVVWMYGGQAVNIYALWYDTTPVTNPTIYSAAEDTLYIYDTNNNVVPIATTDAEGKYYGYIPLAEGTYTIYSSVAKDPDNLSNPYSKTVTITNATTEVWLMPSSDKVLYWYGYNGGVVAQTTANGWSLQNTSWTIATPTFNLNSVTMSASAAQHSGIASSEKISTSKFYAISGTSSGQAGGSGIGMLRTKVWAADQIVLNAYDTANSLYTVTNPTSDSGYIVIGIDNGRTRTCNALWYE